MSQKLNSIANRQTSPHLNTTHTPQLPPLLPHHPSSSLAYQHLPSAPASDQPCDPAPIPQPSVCNRLSPPIPRECQSSSVTSNTPVTGDSISRLHPAQQPSSTLPSPYSTPLLPSSTPPLPSTTPLIPSSTSPTPSNYLSTNTTTTSLSNSHNIPPPITPLTPGPPDGGSTEPPRDVCTPSNPPSSHHCQPCPNTADFTCGVIENEAITNAGHGGDRERVEVGELEVEVEVEVEDNSDVSIGGCTENSYDINQHLPSSSSVSITTATINPTSTSSKPVSTTTNTTTTSIPVPRSSSRRKQVLTESSLFSVKEEFPSSPSNTTTCYPSTSIPTSTPTKSRHTMDESSESESGGDYVQRVVDSVICGDPPPHYYYHDEVEEEEEEEVKADFTDRVYVNTALTGIQNDFYNSTTATTSVTATATTTTTTTTTTVDTKPPALQNTSQEHKVKVLHEDATSINFSPKVCVSWCLFVCVLVSIGVCIGVYIGIY